MTLNSPTETTFAPVLFTHFAQLLHDSSPKPRELARLTVGSVYFVSPQPPYLLNPAVHVQVNHPVRGGGRPHDPRSSPGVGVRLCGSCCGLGVAAPAGLLASVSGSAVRQHPPPTDGSARSASCLFRLAPPDSIS